MLALTDPRFKVSVHCFERACQLSREHENLAKHSLKYFGEHGADVSGCVREHFPDYVKARLRRIARDVTAYSAQGYNARPPRIREATMRKLASMIATRDGSGFYGPQPNSHA